MMEQVTSCWQAIANDNLSFTTASNLPVWGLRPSIWACRPEPSEPPCLTYLLNTTETGSTLLCKAVESVRLKSGSS